MRYLSASAIVAIAGLLGTIGEVKGQQVEDSGCLRLLGSVACPGCESPLSPSAMISREGLWGKGRPWSALAESLVAVLCRDLTSVHPRSINRGKLVVQIPQIVGWGSYPRTFLSFSLLPSFSLFPPPSHLPLSHPPTLSPKPTSPSPSKSSMCYGTDSIPSLIRLPLPRKLVKRIPIL